MRTYDELVSAIIRAIPSTEEIDAMSPKQIEDLRKIGNTFDNQLYLSLPGSREAINKALGR